MNRFIKPKLAFRNKTPEEKVAICHKFIKGLAKVPEAQRPEMRLEQFEESFDAAEDAMAEVARLRSALTAAINSRNRAIGQMCLMARVTAIGYMVWVSREPAQLLRTGLELPAKRRPIGLAGAPKFLRAERSDHPGAVMLRWKRPVRRCAFAVEFTDDPKGRTGWKECGFGTKAKLLVKKLEPGRLYWFRVSAINSAGHSPWSQMVGARPE